MERDPAAVRGRDAAGGALAGLGPVTLTREEAREHVIAAARRLAPEFEARAAELESLRTMPGDLVDSVRREGLFKMLLPRQLGGFELDPLTAIEVVEIVSRADGSAGWTVLIGNGTAFFAWLEPAVAERLVGTTGDWVTTSVYGPMGMAEPAGDGTYRLSGRWAFNSGCPHCEWQIVGAFIGGDAGPRMRPDGRPDWRFAYLPMRSGVIEDTWDALGLRGTGSHHVSISGAIVSEDCMPSPLFEPARFDGPLWRLPLMTQSAILIAGFPLGVGRRVLDEFTELAKTKFRGTPAETLLGDSHTHVMLAQAEAALQSARSYVFDMVGQAWESCLNGDVPSAEERARVHLGTCQAMKAAVEALDAVFRLSGASTVYHGQVMERCLRDLRTANQHIIFSDALWKPYARLRLGLDPGGPFPI
jgi:indole-3-acetate monooxygenase